MLIKYILKLCTFYLFQKGDWMKNIPPTACRAIPVPDELEPYCSLCLREKTDPRVMDCLHVFCLECIVGCRVIAGTYECRICKEWTCVQNNDPKNLLVDHGLANFMELKRFKEGLAHCVVCSKDQSTLKAYCVVCQGFLCHDCTSGHSNAKCKDNFYSIDEYISQDLWKVKRLVCSTHRSFTSYFCESCNASKCPNCITDICQPASHRYDRLENFRAEMRSAVIIAQRRIREAPSLRKDIEVQHTRLEQDYRASEREIDKITKIAIEQVKKQADRLKRNLRIAFLSQEVNK